MFKSILLLTGFCVLATVSRVAEARFYHHDYLQCWTCSSDTVGSEDFCDRTFKESNIPYEEFAERNILVLKSCNSTYDADYQRPVCRKTVEEINGKEVTKRFCYYTNKSDPLDQCSRDAAAAHDDKKIYCQDCTTDRCNSATRFVAFVTVLLMPAMTGFLTY